MHEAVMLINPDRDPGFPQCGEGRSLLWIIEPFPIGEDANIYAPPFRLDQCLTRRNLVRRPQRTLSSEKS
ncbi:MAG: hypothetical protein HC794_04150 [Nitrospiraceae bacterium]|nr:hypothetical protein [Nitrospiraceae bacterium]